MFHTEIAPVSVRTMYHCTALCRAWRTLMPKGTKRFFFCAGSCREKHCDVISQPMNQLEPRHIAHTANICGQAIQWAGFLCYFPTGKTWNQSSYPFSARWFWIAACNYDIKLVYETCCGWFDLGNWQFVEVLDELLSNSLRTKLEQKRCWLVTSVHSWDVPRVAWSNHHAEWTPICL